MATVVAELWEELDLDVEWVREKVDKAKLIEDEVARVKRFYTKHKDPAHHAQSVEAFVTRCFEAKESLINEWGGWWHHSDETLLTEMTVDEDELTQLQAELTNWLRKTYGDNHLLYKWHYDAQYGYEMPYPKDKWRLWPIFSADPNLWSNRLFEGAGAAKAEKIFLYDHFHQVKVKQTQSVARAVLAQARKDYKGAEEWVKILERWCEMLGVYWSRKNTISLTLSCAPSTFLKLGYFGEGGSCFATSNASHKITLAKAPRAFVGLVYKGKEEETKIIRVPHRPRGGVPSGRFWGFMVNGAAQVSNQYRLSWPAILPSLKGVLSDLWKDEVRVETKLAGNDNNFILNLGNLEGLYFNGDLHWLMGKKVETWGQSKQAFEEEFKRFVVKRVTCAYCGNKMDQADATKYKNNFYHAVCLRRCGIEPGRVM